MLVPASLETAPMSPAGTQAVSSCFLPRTTNSLPIFSMAPVRIFIRLVSGVISVSYTHLFKENKLSILPISRGEYIIGGFETHAKIKYDSVRPTPVPVPNLQTIDYTNLYSESSALLFAYNSGIIADILGGEAVFTVNGRMSSGSFSYWVRNNRLPAGEQHLDVVNAQVEIDAGYESRDALMLCEAKNVAVDELLIRQLYYPYRLWSSKISKPILPVFLVYSNDVFHAFIYRFFDREFYNSLELVEHKAYTFADEDIHLKDVVDIWNSIQCTEEPPITFPQADTFSRIVDILSVLYEKTMTPEAVSYTHLRKNFSCALTPTWEIQ